MEKADITSALYTSNPVSAFILTPIYPIIILIAAAYFSYSAAMDFINLRNFGHVAASSFRLTAYQTARGKSAQTDKYVKRTQAYSRVFFSGFVYLEEFLVLFGFGCVKAERGATFAEYICMLSM
jgi:hypothetical protein